MSCFEWNRSRCTASQIHLVSRKGEVRVPIYLHASATDTDTKQPTRRQIFQLLLGTVNIYEID